MRTSFPLLIALVLSLGVVSCETQSPTQTPGSGKSANLDGTLLAVQRPIEEWVAAQGTFCWPDEMGGCLLFVPPVENFLGWSDPARGICAAFDYAGLADAWITAASGGAVSFGTTFSGSVTERPLTDGRAEVHVRLHTKNAMTFATDGCDFAGDPLLFGGRAPEVLAGGEAGLGNVNLHVKFIATAPGAPLPDLLQLLFFPNEGEETLMLSVNVSATGPLHAAFGVPEGTPGRLACTQTGLFFTNFRGATADGFPVERILIQPLETDGRGEVN